jgi:ribonuclease T2
MRKAFASLLAVLLAAVTAGGEVGGQFDFYTFSLSWEPAFCASHGASPECAAPSPGRADPARLTLHGLWPDRRGGARYGYCGADAKTRALDRANAWCRLPAPDLSDATRSALVDAMPGVASCLERHEWVKHGACSELAADDYFSAAAALTVEFNRTTLARFLAANAGKTVRTAQANAAFERDFGPGSRRLLALYCASAGREPVLVEARLRLAKELRPGAGLKAQLIDAGGRGNCPSSFRLEAVPAG